MSDQLPAPITCPCRCHDGPGKPCTEIGGCWLLHRELAGQRRRDHASVVAQVHAAASAAASAAGTPASGRRSAHGHVTEPHSPEATDPQQWPLLTDDEITEARERCCARHQRCPDKTRVENPDGTHARTLDDRDKIRKVWKGAQIHTERGLCSTCTRAVHQDLPKLVADWVELATLLAPGSGGGGEVVSSSRDLPVNLRLGVEALQRAIDDTATFWAECVAETLGVDWDTQTARDTRPAIRVQRAVHLVAASVDTLLNLGPREQTVWQHGEWVEDPDYPGVQATVERDGIDGALQLLDLHERTAQTALRGDLKHHLPAPCPRCDRLALVRWNGESQVECEACRDRWPEDDYVRLTMVLSSEETLRIRQCKRCDKTGRLRDRRMCDHSSAA